MNDRILTIMVSNEEFLPLIRRELEWMRDHIIDSGADYCRSKKRRDAMVKAFNLVLENYTRSA